MLVRHDDPSLERLETDAGFNGNFAAQIVNGFRRVMGFIRNVKDERDFRAMRSLNFERLQGDRSDDYSMRITKQWRLIVRFEGEHPKKVLVVIAIEDYH